MNRAHHECDYTSALRSLVAALLLALTCLSTPAIAHGQADASIDDQVDLPLPRPEGVFVPELSENMENSVPAALAKDESTEAIIPAVVDAPELALATVITVNTTTDELNADGDCSLREAVQAANQDKAVSGCPAGSGVDTINIPAGTYTLNKADAGALRLTESTILKGDEAATTFIDGNADGRSVIETTYHELLVCDSGDNTVKRFSTKGSYASTLVKTASNGGLSLPNAARVNFDSTILYVSGFGSGIKRYRLNSGTYSDTLVAASGAYGSWNTLSATDMAFDGNDVYVADYYNPNDFSDPGRVLKFNASTGAYGGEFVTPGSGGLTNPNSMVFNGSHLYVTDASGDKVLRYNKATGAFVSTFVGVGSGGLSRPRGLVFYGGFLFVSSENTDQVLKYNASTGAFVSVFVAAGSGGLDKPQGLTFGPDGNLYVSSNATKQILRYNGTTGAFIDVFVDSTENIDGTAGCPVFVGGLGSGPIVNISNVTLQNSVTDGNPGTGHGIFNSADVSLTLSRSVVRNNKSNSPGAGISNSGNLTIVDSSITANQTLTGEFGGVQYSGGGVMNYSSGILKINRSTISNNISVRGGGIRNAGGKLEMTNSTVSGNRAQARGGGLMNFGVAWIAFSTLTNNEANIVTWPHSGSEDTYGGGIYNQGQVDIGNSIVAGNKDNYTKFDPNYGPDCWNDPADPFNFTSFRGNLIGIHSVKCNLRDTTWGDQRFDQIGTPDAPLDAKLSALANNGGPTFTHKPQATSPAIDNGDGVTSATFFDCPSIDQRNAVRPHDGNADATIKCDVGAVEYGASIYFVKLPMVIR